MAPRPAQTDFFRLALRRTIPKITVPTLILHAGDTDRILPPDQHSRRLAKLIPGVRFVEIEGGAHDIHVTHTDQVNPVLIDFLR